MKPKVLVCRALFVLSPVLVCACWYLGLTPMLQEQRTRFLISFATRLPALGLLLVSAVLLFAPLVLAARTAYQKSLLVLESIWLGVFLVLDVFVLLAPPPQWFAALLYWIPSIPFAICFFALQTVSTALTVWLLAQKRSTGG